jgi:organic hydroperoxide reductase OsmC/OhrA
MSEHRARIVWARSSADFTYASYNREHEWRFKGGVVVAASAAPQFKGSEQCPDPEDAFVASLSSCHMLTFLAIAARRGFTVDRYEDAAVGHLEKNAQGKLAITRVHLHPAIEFAGERKPDAALLDQMHTMAHHECFIANSVLTIVEVKPAESA